MKGVIVISHGFLVGKMIRGSLMDDAVLSDFSSLGEEYTAYASQVCATLAPINKADEDTAIITKVVEMENGEKTYLHAKYDDEKYILGRNGFIVSIDLLHSKDYPEISEKIKMFYCGLTEKSITNRMSEAIQQLVLRSDTSDKESVLQKEIFKLKLFFLCGTMNLVSGAVTVPHYPIFAKGFQATNHIAMYLAVIFLEVWRR